MTPPRTSYRASPEATARVLLLIDAFSRLRDGTPRELEGRIKLAKLDFLLRYPHHLARVLEMRGVSVSSLPVAPGETIDDRMMRYRYGPWDPAYYAILGALIGRGLVEAIPLAVGKGLGFRTSRRGAELAADLKQDAAFESLDQLSAILRRHLDLGGSTLKNFIYRLPGVSSTRWRDEIE